MPEPIIQLIFQDRILETIKILKDVTTVGRMPDNDVVINNLGVSRHHCRIVKEGEEQFKIEDMESANGIKVNGVKLMSSPLHNGDEIVIGKHKLIFQLTERGVAGFFKSEEEETPQNLWSGDRTIFTGAPPVPEAPPEPEAPSTKEPEPVERPEGKPAAEFDRRLFEYVLKWCEHGIKVTFEGKVVSVHALKMTDVIIGRGQDCSIVIDNLGVSRQHAKIYAEGDQYLIEDLGSANGIKVNGVQVRRTPIYPGDEILIGKHVLTFDLAKRILEGIKTEDIKRPAHSDQYPEETYALYPPMKEEGGQEPAPIMADAIKEVLPWDGKYSVKVQLDGRDVASYAITKKVTCIGRLKENDVVIDNIGVSRLHAKIIIEDSGQVHIEDQESANGIVVNGLPLRRSPLYPGDEITIVKHKLIFELSHKVKPILKAAGGGVSTDPWSHDSTMMVSEEDRERLKKQWAERAEREKAEKEAAEITPPPTPVREEQAPAAAKHSVLQKGLEAAAQYAGLKDPKLFEPTPPSQKVKRYLPKLLLPDGKAVNLEKDETVLGSSNDADVRVEGSMIKARHVLIVKEEAVIYRLVAKSLFKRPRVNGEKVADKVLKPGDVITFGNFTATFQLEMDLE